MAIDFRLMQGNQGSPLQNAMAGYEFGQRIRDDQREQEQRSQMQSQQAEASTLFDTLSKSMEDPEFKLASSVDLQRLEELSPESAQRSRERFTALSAEDQQMYIDDMITARDMAVTGNIQGGANHLASRITRLAEGGRRPDDTIRSFMLYQNDPEYFVNGVNQMLASTEQAKNRDVSYAGPEKGEPKVGRFRSIDAGTDIQIMDSASGEIVKKITKSPTAAQEANDTMKQLEVVNKRQSQVNAVFEEQEGLDLAKRAATISSDLAANEGLSSVVGGQFYLDNTPTFANSQAVINKALELASLVTKDNLRLMTGVLTQKDIEFLQRISSGGLNITENGILGNYEQVVKDLTELSNRLTASSEDKQPVIDKRLFNGKQSGQLGRAIKQEDVTRLRAAGFSTRQIYDMLKVE